ncbi:pirin family protein [Apibacter sp. HY039]|uniref:pirin family protein n=1 Tax=Apibacter sp. HY039 TaxID=2501476 RepID=UPI000FEB9EB4|nr:pirin family protein [Apibacter sp. HY039]
MKTTLYVASSRGHANHGWLDSYHTFSFANYFDPERIQFGALRVINDDIVKEGKGFGLHPHKNMEIISIPLYGDLEHKDDMGNSQTIKSGDVQVMSAGSGVQHSEYNPNPQKPVNFFQIWILPAQQNVTPRYEQKTFNFFDHKNKLISIVSPVSECTENELGIYQNAWMSTGIFDNTQSIDYKMHLSNNGLYAMVIEGEFLIEGKKLTRRDGLAIWETNSVTIKSITDNSRLLLIEVPMNP